MGGITDVEPGAGGIHDQQPGPAGKRYIKIAVPNFNGDTNPMGSYLRIGGVDPSITPGVPNAPPGTLDVTGEDLASLVTTADGTSTFADDARDRGPSTATPPPAPESLPPGSPAATLAQESSRTVLHGKGGWRDHTDGNRISTTRGDKVEVIRGNYKMIILGRQDLSTDPNGDYFFDEWATGLDESGGLADNADQSHGVNGVLDVSYTWQQNSDGRWGWTQVTRTGTFDTRERRTTQGNGKQITFTWVDEIWTYVGSPEPDTSVKPVVLPLDDTKVPKPVKKMFSETWAETITQTTNAVTITGGPVDWSDDGSIIVEGPTPDPNSTPAVTASISTTTKCQGDITTVSRSFGQTNSTTEAVGGITNIQTCGSKIGNHTTASSMNNHTTCSGYIYEETWAPLHANMEWSLFLIELKTLLHLDMHIGMHADMHVNHLDFHVCHLDFHMGAHATVDMFTHVTLHAEPEKRMAPAYLYI